MIQTCPECFGDMDVTWERVGGGVVRYTCSGRHPDAHEFIWETTLERAGGGGSGSAESGVTAELFDPMLECVLPGDPFVEYGIVEYRFSQRYPHLYKAHIAERGHVMVEPSRVTASNSRFGPTLVRLAKRGMLTRVFGKATGAWSYNGKTTYWARPGAAETRVVTWEQHCVEIGRPSWWTAEDLRAATE